MISAIDKELNTYIKLLDISQKKSLLDVIKSYLQPNDKTTLSLEEYNKELDDSEAEIDRGESYSHEQVKEISNSWTSGK